MVFLRAHSMYWQHKSLRVAQFETPTSKKVVKRLRRNSSVGGSWPLALLLFAYVTLNIVGIRLATAQTSPRQQTPLASQAFDLMEETEVGLEIEARSPGASWSRRGAEAAALSILVDGEYNQDLLLWAGDELFTYRVLLGRLAKGKHTVSVALNSARSAAGARQAEVKSLRPLPLKAKVTNNEDQLALAYSPILYARANTIDRFTDLPLLMYYEGFRENNGDLIVRYTAIFTNEDGGTATAALMARWGRATDIEWVYQLRVRNQQIIEEIYQGVEHETKPFTGQRTLGRHPLLAIASDNNNFSDLACSAVRFAPLPIRARLEAATRESVMDAYPQTYRVMTEELFREKRISDTPVEANTIADPRQYLYIEAVAEQEGAALAFDVRVAGEPQVFASDHGDPRLRIDRSGYFRTAIRLPKNGSPATIETITARCSATAKAAAERRCKNLKVVRALMLDRDYRPRLLPLRTQPAATLVPGEMKMFDLTRSNP